MKVLVLHNNNVPFFLRSNEEYELRGDITIFKFKEDIAIHSIVLKYESNISSKTYDSFICSKLSFLENECYDLIITPYTFSRDNYMEYSGLRVVTHIRLTKEWNHLTAPILFLGPDNIDDIVRLSELSNIITSYRIFMCDKHDKEDIETIIRNTVCVNQYDCEAEKIYPSSRRYAKMVSKLRIKAPVNYATHHSIANVWGVQRWGDMIQCDVKFKDEDLKDQLFYKCLRARTGEPQRFNSKWRKSNPSLLTFGFSPNENFKIAYIDDEHEKGWDSLLSHIFESQPIDFQSCDVFDDNLSKTDLIEKIQSFIDSFDADCYILDLRLHESDFDNDIESKDITGHKIAKYIKQKNIANQIVVFTASNKVWNLKEELHKIGASGYVIKESPELLYDRNQTYRNFQDFQKEIRHACRQSYIKRYVTATKDLEFPTLDSFIKLLLIDKTESKEDVLAALILNLIVFVEDYVQKNFEIREGDNLYLKDSSEPFANIRNKIRFRRVGENGDKYFEKVSCSDTKKDLDEDYNTYALAKDKDGNPLTLTLVISVLFFHYHFPMNIINQFLYAKNQRNRKIAHNGNKVDMTIKDVKKIFEEIILPILKNLRNNDK